jgi:acid phosphatase (class A)
MREDGSMRGSMASRLTAIACVALSLSWLAACAAQPRAAVQAARQPATPTAAPAPAAAPAVATGQARGGPPIDARVFLATPPAAGSTEAASDLARVHTIQRLATPERRGLAVADAELEPWKAFAAPLGRELDPGRLPVASRLMSRVRTDVLAAGVAKNKYARPRPFVADATLDMCLPGDRLRLEASYSYPSGHATYGWTVALLLAEMLPERAEAILLRGRDYGDSRVVCGVHYPSDVEAGRLVASGLVAKIHADPAFVEMLSASRKEILIALAAP